LTRSKPLPTKFIPEEFMAVYLITTIGGRSEANIRMSDKALASQARETILGISPIEKSR